MSSTIKKIGITYNSINASNTFTNGDVVSGQVEVELAKDCQIESFYIKFKGKAEVLWSETYGQTTQVYHSKEKYFTLRHYFIKSKNSTDDQQTLITNESGATFCGCVLEVSLCQPDVLEVSGNRQFSSNGHGNLEVSLCQPDVLEVSGNRQFFSNGHGNLGGAPLSTRCDGKIQDEDCSVVPPGIHVYPFSFQFPLQDIPSSFKGEVGKIIYQLEAVLSRSMRTDSKEKVPLNFLARDDLNPVADLKVPQHESKDKKMGLFKSGSIAMDVNLEKSGFHQGEGLKVSALIKNDSSREVKPKYCIYKKHSFFARGRRRVHTKDLIKEVGATIPPSASEKVTQVIPIPQDMEPSILNCNNIKVEHRLRVYLDIKYASDPEVKFNIFILQAPAMASAPPAASDFGNGLFENYGNPNPPVWDFGPPQPPAVFLPADPPPSYGTYGMYPPLNDFANKY